MIGSFVKDTDIHGSNNKFVGGDDNSSTYNCVMPYKSTKLSLLFRKLKDHYEQGSKIDCIRDDLSKFTGERDKIGLEQKLIDADMAYLYDEVAELKEDFFKKLTKYELFDPAQEIYSYILACICERFRNIIYPLIKKGEKEDVVRRAVSDDIISPLISLIQQEGCDDIMGLSAADIEGMVYYLTGNCHIRWKI